MIMGGSSIPKADYDLMAIMYSAYGIHHMIELLQVTATLIKLQLTHGVIIVQFIQNVFARRGLWLLM